MSKKLKIIIAAMLIMTCIVAVIHLNSQEDISCMVIRYREQELPISFEDLCKTEFSGETVNGKGDISFHEYSGILLYELLSDKGIDVADISMVTVTSADNYSAEYTRDEILSDSKIYIAVKIDGETVEGIAPGITGAQIIAFGDSDSRRCVRYAVIIECT